MTEVDADRSLAVFGKLPSQGDFVRVNMHAVWGVAFEAWLADAVEHARGKLPSYPVRFVLTLGARERVLGAWVPSVDAVGREFPLVALRLLSEEITAAPWSLLPAFYADYLEEVERALFTLRGADASALLPALSALALPHPSLIPAAWHAGQQALTAEALADFASRNLPDGLVDHLLYAVATFSHAREQASDPLTLDVPAANDLDLFGWLEIARALKVGAVAPSLVWSTAGQRALLVLSALAPLTIAFLLDSDHPSQRRWPLVTSRESALQAARESLTPVLRNACIPSGSMASLIAALSVEVTP